MSLRVAAAQTSLRKGSPERAIEAAKDLIREAAKSGAQIICLPEHWLLEYGNKATNVENELAEAARASQIFVITGANYVRNGLNVRIRSTLIDPQGKIVGSQEKIHLFRDEITAAVPGEKYQVLQTSFGKVGITVCYDNVFPEAARTLALRGADVLFVPSRIVSQGLDPWLLYLRTRALENRIPVVAPNVFDPPRYPGGSAIIDLAETEGTPVVLPKIIASAGAGERVIVANINIERARELRSKRLSERVTSTYDLT